MENEELKKKITEMQEQYHKLVEECIALLPPKMNEEEILKIIQDISWKGGRSFYEHYNIGYSPYHRELAKALSGKIEKSISNSGECVDCEYAKCSLSEREKSDCCPKNKLKPSKEIEPIGDLSVWTYAEVLRDKINELILIVNRLNKEEAK